MFSLKAQLLLSFYDVALHSIIAVSLWILWILFITADLFYRDVLSPKKA